MQAFDCARAYTVVEAVDLLQQDNQARVLAGGTDLIVGLREQRIHARLVVDVKAIQELGELAFDPVAGLLPMIDTVLVEVPHPGQPSGVRSVGETQIVQPAGRWPTRSFMPPVCA